MKKNSVADFRWKLKVHTLSLHTLLLWKFYNLKVVEHNNNRVKYHVYLLLIRKCFKVQFIVIPNVLLFFLLKKRNCFHCDRIKKGKMHKWKKWNNIFRLDLEEAIAPQHVLMLDIWIGSFADNYWQLFYSSCCLSVPTKAKCSCTGWMSTCSGSPVPPR